MGNFWHGEHLRDLQGVTAQFDRSLETYLAIVPGPLCLKPLWNRIYKLDIYIYIYIHIRRKNVFFPFSVL